MSLTSETNDLILTVVDDEPLVLEMLVRAARSWKYQCQTASSAIQALEMMDKRRTPILVTDINMPDRDGIWLVKEVHQRWPEVGIIVVTAGQDSEAAIKCLNAGAHRYFLKPIRLDEFRHALKSTLESYRLRESHNNYHDYLEKTVRRQTRQLRRNFMCTIDSLVRTLEARDPYTCGHSMRVRQYALRLAEALGLNRSQRKRLGLAAKLHDIGKIGVPEVILNKPGLLTEEEFDVVKAHPVIGERILKSVIRNRDVLSAIRGHHERYDGHGYPDRIGGEKIPLLARILTVPDCFDALTTARAYRVALPVSQALEVLREGAGTQFQADLVHVFIDMITAAPFTPEVPVVLNGRMTPVAVHPTANILTKD